MMNRERPIRSASASALLLGASFLLLSSFAAAPASAQLRDHDLRFRPPADSRVVGFRVYVSANSMSYADYRDDINFIPTTDSSGVATYRLTDLEAFEDVFLTMRSYDGSGNVSAPSNEIVLPAQDQCLVITCNDNNTCTSDSCGPDGCVFNPAPNVGRTCNDGNSGTIDDKCSSTGVCRGTVPQCVVDTDCPAPTNQCAGPQVCSSNMCVAGPLKPAGSTCNDGNAGTFDDKCTSGGSCVGTVAQCSVDADCPASTNPCAGPQVCSNRMCVAGAPRADGTTCNDGNDSTRLDVCESGTCRGYACGTDAHCSDGEGCNGTERCSNRTCVAGTPMVCSDDNRCNGTETCSNSTCVAGTPMTCPTQDGPCFDAFCDPAQGCRVSIHPDGTTCTTATTSLAGMCASGVCVAETTEPPVQEDRDPRPSEQGTPTTCETAYGVPTDVHQVLTSSPETSRKLVWSAPLHPMGSLLEYRADYVGSWTTLRAFPESSTGCDAVWSVTLTGLKPRTRYYYRVSGASADGRVWTEMMSLRTNSVSRRDKFKFAFFASNGLDASAQSTQAIEVVTQIKKGGFPLVLGGGGYALSSEAMAAGVVSDADAAIAAWKEQARPVTGNSIFAPVLGDTEIESSTHAERAADYAEFMSGMDSSAPSGSYAFDYSGVHFVGLAAPTLTAIHPGNSAGAAQLAWLDANLGSARAAGARWLVVYLHADVFSSESNDPNTGAVRTALGNILLRHGVNLVLSGEGNSYERTHALRGNLANPTIAGLAVDEVVTATDGVVFARAGSGGRTVFGRWLSATPPRWSALRDNTRAVFLSVQVSEKALVLKAFGLDERGKRAAVDQITIR